MISLKILCKAYITKLVLLVVVALFSVVICRPAISQALKPTSVYPGVNIIEVFVESVGGGESGRGWAFTDSRSDTQRCLVITPWHVISDGIEPSSEIYITGPGTDQEPLATVLKQGLRFYDSDIAVLKIGRNNPCPFEASISEFKQDEKLYLQRTRGLGAGIERLELDRNANLLPVSDDGVVWSASTSNNSTKSIMKGWSGASVIRDGFRIGMVTSTPADQKEVYFVSVAGMQWLFGERIDLVNPGKGFLAAKARNEIVKLGFSFSATDLQRALASGDDYLLGLFETAGVENEIVERALKIKYSNSGDSTAHTLFQLAKNAPELVNWFRNRLVTGLDPNLQVGGKLYQEEAILSVAIRVGSPDIIIALLEAGANPHPIQNLKGTLSLNPHFLNPISAIANHDSMSYTERREVALALIESGAPLPDTVSRLPDGTIDTTDLNLRGKMVARKYKDPLTKLDLDQLPTPDTCEAPQSNICVKAEETYGVEWCQELDTLPKGFNGQGEGAHLIPPMFLKHLIAVDRNNAYFLAKIRNLYSSSHEPHRVLKVSRDRSVVQIMTQRSSYNCNVNNGDSGSRYCWEIDTLHRKGTSEEYKQTRGWSATYNFYELCELADKHDKMFYENLPDTSWMNEYAEDYQLIDSTTRGLIRYSAGPISREASKRLANDLARYEISTFDKYSRQSTQQRGDNNLISWVDQHTKEDKETFLYKMLFGESNLLDDEKTILDESYLEILLTDAQVLKHETAIPEIIRGSETAISEMMEFATENLLFNKYLIVTELPPMEYDEDLEAMVNVSNRAREIGEMRIAPPIERPFYVGDELPDQGRYIVLVPDRGQEYDLMKPQFSRLQKLRRAYDPLLREKEKSLSSWQPDFSNSLIDIQVLALDRIVTFDKFPIEKERIIEIFDNRSTSRTQPDNWRIISVVESQGAEALLPRDITTLFAELKEVLLISPDDELIERYPAEMFPSVPKIPSLETTSLKASEIKSPLTLNAETVDFLVAKHRPDLLNGDILYGMIVSRWIYEKETDDPIGGLFFKPSDFLPTARQFKRLYPSFVEWLVERGNSLPDTFITPITVTQDRGGSVWSHLVQKPSCIHAMSENKNQNWTVNVHNRDEIAVAKLVSSLGTDTCGGSKNAQTIRDGESVVINEGTVSGTKSRIGVIFDLETPSTQLAGYPPLIHIEGGEIEIQILGNSTDSDYVWIKNATESIRLEATARLVSR